MNSKETEEYAYNRKLANELSLEEYMERLFAKYGNCKITQEYNLLKKQVDQPEPDTEIYKQTIKTLKGYLREYENRLRQMENIVGLAKGVLRMDLKETNEPDQDVRKL